MKPESPCDEFGQLPRLPPEYYRGQAYVHWSMTTDGRKTGWVIPLFNYKLREGPWQGPIRGAANGRLSGLSERWEMIRYPDFAAKGWPTGSGPTESGCQTRTRRLGGSGMRWDADNAEAIMASEARRESGL
ncbi:MAG TPA: hypothetical protein VH092_02765 [Urbifossiella sp.]|jgi:hypothetical protein|nr:hypothetical protein [Urbifossiella sp.]